MATNKFTDSPRNLLQRLAYFNPARHGGESMVSQMMGTERFTQLIDQSEPLKIRYSRAGGNPVSK